jgi:hypothetical protein
MFGGRVFQQTVGISMAKINVLLFSPTCSFIRMRQTLYRASTKYEKKIARSFNFTFRYIDNVLSLNNSTFGDIVDRIYPIDLEI